MNYKQFVDRIVVAGSGSAYWTIAALCREVQGRIPIEVYDDDVFNGGTGHTRLPKPATQEQFKVDHLKMFISFVMGDTPPLVRRRKLLPSELLVGNWTRTLVVDATDMNDIDRADFWRAIEANGSRALRLALDGNGVATVSPGPPIPSGKNEQGYGDLPTQGQVFRAAGQGAEAIIYFLLTGELLEFQTFVPTSTNKSILIERTISDVNRDSNSENLSSSETESGTDRDRTLDNQGSGDSSEGQERMADSASGD